MFDMGKKTFKLNYILLGNVSNPNAVKSKSF